MLRLVRSGADDHGYTALSYCWKFTPTSPKHFLTTKNNVVPRLSGFSLYELPKTLRGAVQTVHDLGINYI